MSRPGLDQPFVTGSVETDLGPIPRVSYKLERKDIWGTIKARLGISRMNYKIDPGIYAIGNPDKNSHVLVSSNYKMSFDFLRKELRNYDAWILVLDTNGINVWCAAGKGTFGTEELVGRIKSSGLSSLVSHRTLILPQLGAPGVSAHRVKELSGFKVIYGPIQAKDLPRFIHSGLKAKSSMRIKNFTILERMVLIPVEIVTALKYAILLSVLFFIAGGLGGPDGFWNNAFNYGIFSVISIFGGIAAGALISPIMLPWLPGRAFSLKGIFPGIIIVILLSLFRIEYLGTLAGKIETIGWFLLIPSISAYLSMNFTGCSTYTSLSGVKKEMKYAVPLEIGAAATGLCLWIGARFLL